MKKRINNIGQAIKKRRIEIGWSQIQLAKASRYSRIYIIKLENRQIKSPGIKALNKISSCLGIELEALWK